jgi:hypothetical protein
VAVAVALVSTSAFAVAPFGNNTQRGSLLIFPRIEVNGAIDTLVQIVNDYSYDGVNLKCYYLAPGPTYSSPKYVKDFGKRLTANQPITFWASTGKNSAGTRVVPVGFSPFPPLAGGAGNVSATKGELKCWAVGAGNLPIHHNHLMGTASIINGANAAEYTAFAFEALDPDRGTAANTGKPLSGTALGAGDAQLLLDGKMYDSCPVQLLAAYEPTNRNQITIVGCNQDLRQDRDIWKTKLNYTFWDADENPVTGWYECADSWYDRYISEIEGSRIDTPIAYFRVFGAPSTVCSGPQRDSGLMGVIITDDGTGAKMRGTNMTGRGEYKAGWIKYNLPNNASQAQ